MKQRRLSAIHPGEILREEFMLPAGLNPHKLAMALRVSAPTVSEIVREKRGISPEIALRLSRYFGTSAKFWLNLQSNYDVRVAEERYSDTIERDVVPLVSALRR